jgi:regulator of protease activity HflC (stomatin/prohibitin superfamily)
MATPLNEEVKAVERELAGLRDRFRAWVRRNAVGILLTSLIFLALLAYFAPRIFISIGPGQAGVKWRRFFGGTVTISGNGKPFVGRIDADAFGNPTRLGSVPKGYDLYPYSEGMRLVFPWDRMYIYNIRLQQVSHTYNVLTSDGLDIKVETTITFKPIEADLGKLHRDIGPNYIETLIVPIVGAYTREEIARYTPDALYSPIRLQIQEAIRSRTKQALLSRFYPEDKRESYIIVEDVLIRNVVLPAEVEQAIQEKVVQKHLAESYTYRLLRERQEAERKQIEADGINRFQSAINSSISEGYLKWKGIDATLELAKSPNAKVVVIGGKDGLPVILGGLDNLAGTAAGPVVGPTRPAPVARPATTAAPPP